MENSALFPSHDQKGIDQTKQYTSITNRGELLYVDIHDEVKYYEGRAIEKGFYYIETKQNFPFRGNGFYDYQLISYGLENELINKEEIKFYFTAQSSEEIDKSMKTFIDECYKTKYGKELVNTFIGSLNMTKTKQNLKNFIVESWIEAGYYFHLCENATISTIDLPSRKLYRIQAFEQFNKLRNNALIRTSIVQWIVTGKQ